MVCLEVFPHEYQCRLQQGTVGRNRTAARPSRSRPPQNIQPRTIQSVARRAAQMQQFTIRHAAATTSIMIPVRFDPDTEAGYEGGVVSLVDG